MKKLTASLILAASILAGFAAPGPVNVSTSTTFKDPTVLTNVTVALPAGTFNNATFYVPATTTKGAVQFNWTVSSGAAGYALYWGDITSSASNRMDVLGNTGALFFTLNTNVTYFFYVTAYDSTKTEGAPSNVLVLKPGT